MIIIIKGWSKLAQKMYKTWHDWVANVIHKDTYKKIIFDHMNQYVPADHCIKFKESKKTDKY